MWDISGNDLSRENFWRSHIADSDAIIFVVDACDENKFLQVQKSLIQVLDYEESKGLPILILANKSDRIEDSPLTSEQLAEAMSIRQLCHKRVICIQKTSTKTGDGLENALERVRAMIGQSNRIFGVKSEAKKSVRSRSKSSSNRKSNEDSQETSKNNLKPNNKFSHLKKKQGKRLSQMTSISYDSPPPPGNKTKTSLDTLTRICEEINEVKHTTTHEKSDNVSSDIAKTDHTIVTSSIPSPSSHSSSSSTTHCWDNTLKSANSDNYHIARAKNYHETNNSNSSPPPQQHRTMIVHKLQPVSAVRSSISVESNCGSGGKRTGRSKTRRTLTGAEIEQNRQKLYFSGNVNKLQLNPQKTTFSKQLKSTESNKSNENASLGSCGNSCNSSLSSEGSNKNNQEVGVNEELKEISQEDTLRRLIRRRRSMLTTSYIGSYDSNSLPKQRLKTDKNYLKPAPPRRSTSRVCQRKISSVTIE